MFAVMAGLTPLEVEPGTILIGPRVLVRRVVDAGRLLIGIPTLNLPAARVYAWGKPIAIHARLRSVSGTARPRRTVELLSLRLDVGAFGGRVSGDFDLRDGRLAGTDLALLGARTEGVIALPASPPAFALGVLRLRAPDDSGVHADAFDATQIRLELDRFLDGSIDATQLTDWSRLRALL